MLRQLIFGSQLVRWSDLRPVEIFGESYKSVLPLDGLSWLPLNAAHIRTFAVPGNPHGSDIEAIKITDQGLLLRPGEHYIISSRGCFKILVLDNDADRFEASFAISRFVSRNSVHSCLDHWRAAPRGQNVPFKLQLLHQKFYFSDQPLGLECGELADFVAGQLVLFGGHVRRVWAMDPETKSGHIVVEILDEETRRWTMVDPDFGVALFDKDGHYLSVEEVANRRLNGSLDSVTIDDLGNKFSIRPEFYFGPDFIGDCTWTAQMCNTVSLADKDHYITNVVGRYFKSIHYYSYKLSGDGILTYATDYTATTK
jgi:hypothetical protein